MRLTIRQAGFIGVAAALSVAGLAVAASRATVDQVGLVFSQASLAVGKGGVVVFNNHDDVTHNITIYDGAGDGVDLGLQKPGVSLNYKFDSQGRFLVRCSIHPAMKMTVEVK